MSRKTILRSRSGITLTRVELLDGPTVADTMYVVTDGLEVFSSPRQHMAEERFQDAVNGKTGWADA